MARIIEADCFCPGHEVVEEAARVVSRGGIVVGPTDTLYGVFADPFNEAGYRRVFRVKGREESKPLPILLAESHHATRLIVADERFWALARAFWPGPLTIAAPAAPGVPEYLAPKGMVGVRLPDCPLARAIARAVGGAVTGTSANKSGRAGPVTVYDAVEQLGDEVDLYIDAGPAPLAKPSTVVELPPGGGYRVLRVGAVSEEEIRGALEGLA